MTNTSASPCDDVFRISIKKRNTEEVLKTSEKKKIVVEEPESDSETETMMKIDNYQDSSADASNNIESSEGKSDSEESSRDTSRDEDNPISSSICARDISGKLYDLATWLDEIVSSKDLCKIKDGSLSLL
ncbi:hypothetical protein KY290_034009 [Solanum tuberosum]|uniref:Uncharacterized protein n=1 Tax=Solanum tuberosum TaxID=4113 RepID=A0ABQ7U207_SOLTU|nr:hypothetical protein KY289_033390 [Solanum tuberosum]KAH0648028.1 hypothetical protein KY285_033276 [Solanum tuberosum]KAH0740966.1 hypothetical protein KY290_034009 [Solanum tuberosum]